MIKNTFVAIATSARALLRNWRVLIVLILVYTLVLGAVYLFFATREATVGQLIETLLVALAAPVLFFVIQTIAIRYRRPDQRFFPLLGGALRDSWKLIVVSLPVVLLAVLVLFLLGQFELKDAEQAVSATPSPPRPPSTKTPPPLQWQAVALTSIQYLMLCMVLPLAAIHLWIVAARDGLAAALRGAGPALAQAFKPGAVLTYAIGFAVFAVAPYFLLSAKTTGASTFTDVGLLVLRLGLALVLSLTGWVITLGALDELMSPRVTAIEGATPEGAPLDEDPEHAPVQP
ncbi:MAG TPA: hypothetical protein VJH03_25700 [Blastocatellia bacterium]|nr:hypothetical protein [Blastocatellia bacterium]